MGATSQIAKDLIVSFSDYNDIHNLWLFSRSPEKVKSQFDALDKHIEYPNLSYQEFSNFNNFDVIINFVGIGDPAKLKEIGYGIFDITDKYDQMALDYLVANDQCKYIFLSSGAVYGGSFNEPVTDKTKYQLDVNNITSKDWYALSKVTAEARHRSLKHLNITDVRVFNYFSRTQDLSERFFITDAIRSVVEKKILQTAPHNIYRDYITPALFFDMILCIIDSGFRNEPIDCYTKEKTSKFSILKALSEKYGLRYNFKSSSGVNATGEKINYYSENKLAKAIGYEPAQTSLEALIDEIRYIV